MALVNTISGSHLVRLLDRWRSLPGARGARLPEYAALAAAVRGLLHDARLPLGVRLPAERELAEALGISRTTVTAAYRQLRTSGYLVSRRGSGSFTTMPEGRRVATSGLWVAEGAGDMIDLGSASLPAPDQFAEAVAAATAELPVYAAGLGYHSAGLPALRERVAARFTARGLPTTPEQVLITNGAQNGFDLILRLLIGPGQPVLVESPTYPNAMSALRAHRARLVTSNLHADHGWDGALLLAELRASRPALAYLIPEFQNPTGHLMPLRLREQLPAAAHRAGTDLVVDESFVELAFEADPMPPVAAFDQHARVLTVGGMSKPFWGGLRVGWIRAAAPVITRLTALRISLDLAGPVFDQLVAVELLDRADEIIGARRTMLQARRDALAAALRTHLPQWTFRLPSGGGCLWVELDAPGATALAQAAQEHGVRLAPGPTFGLAGTLERYTRLPFTLPEADLVEAVRRLASAHADLSRARSASWTPPTLVA